MPESFKQPRQLPGNACDECRRRKLRCDRKRPRCGACANYPSIPCNITEERVPRGPKKGSISAIRNRIVALEKRLSEPTGNTGNSAEQGFNSSYPDTASSSAGSYLPITQSSDQAHGWGGDSPHQYSDYPGYYSHYDPSTTTTTQSLNPYVTTAATSSSATDNYAHSTADSAYVTNSSQAWNDVDWGQGTTTAFGGASGDNTYYYTPQP